MKGLKKLLGDSNSKLKKTSEYFDVKIYNFSIPAFNDKLTGKITCPFAIKKIVDGEKIGCGWFCYAQKGAYNWIQKALTVRYEATKEDNFIERIINELNGKRTKKQIYVRVHDSGDFYSPAYLDKWVKIAKALPHIRFYAYSKSHDFFRNITLPDNFDVTFSTGSKLDNKLNKVSERHADIFNSLKELINADYVNASEYDLYATKWHSKSNKVGLIMH